MTPDWGRLKRRFRLAGAAAPAALAALGVAVAAGSTPRPEIDRTAEIVAKRTQGDLGAAGFQRLTAGYDPALLAVAAYAALPLWRAVVSGLGAADPAAVEAARALASEGWLARLAEGQPQGPVETLLAAVPRLKRMA